MDFLCPIIWFYFRSLTRISRSYIIPLLALAECKGAPRPCYGLIASSLAIFLLRTISIKNISINFNEPKVKFIRKKSIEKFDTYVYIFHTLKIYYISQFRLVLNWYNDYRSLYIYFLHCSVCSQSFSHIFYPWSTVFRCSSALPAHKYIYNLRMNLKPWRRRR